MAVQKLSPNQQRKVDTIHAYQASVAKVKRLVMELEGNRAAKTSIVDNICGTIARELSQLRQRAMAAPIGTLGDVAGALGILAARGGSGMAFKLRGLNEGVNSMAMQLDAALKFAMQHDKDDKH